MSEQLDEATRAALLADADESTAVGEDSLARLNQLIQSQIACESRVARAERELADAKDKLSAVAERELPDFMEQHGILDHTFVDAGGVRHEIKLKAGWRVSLPTVMAGKKPIVDREACKPIYEWFRTIGQGGIIKRDVTVPMGLCSDDAVNNVLTEIKNAHPDLDPAFAEKIEPMTLWSVVSKMKDAGKNVHAALRVTAFKESKISNK